jgi:hypothetical protein
VLFGGVHNPATDDGKQICFRSKSTVMVDELLSYTAMRRNKNFAIKSGSSPDRQRQPYALHPQE